MTKINKQVRIQIRDKIAHQIWKSTRNQTAIQDQDEAWEQIHNVIWRLVQNGAVSHISRSLR